MLGSDVDHDDRDHTSPELAQIYEQERRVPWRPVVLLVAVWLGVFVLSLLRGGGHGTPSLVGTRCLACSP